MTGGCGYTPAEHGDWMHESEVQCVSCPDCAFTFAAFHVTDSTGLYECPVCSETRLVSRVAEAEKALALAGGCLEFEGNVQGALDIIEAALSHSPEAVQAGAEES